MPRDALQEVITSFLPEKLITFFRRRSTSFRQAREELSEFSREQFRDVAKVGEIKFADGMESKLIVVTARAVKPLSERSGKKAQYDLGKKVLATGFYDAGIFVFYDAQGAFRFSLIYPQYVGKKKSWSNFRRFTYFAAPDLANKTFIKQIGDGDFSTLDKVKESFSLAKVTNDFYNEFKGKFEDLCDAVKMDHGKPDADDVKDFALLFVIRVIFLGFIQKRGWIGDDEKFLSTFLAEYTKKGFGRDLFYKKWMEPLFFEALNTTPGTKVAYGVNEFPDYIEKALQMAPYLNGGLFDRRKGADDKGCFITDAAIGRFFEFLFAYNFTIEENTLYDEELELNPEFLGIIFERLVNKENGAVYTPRTEVDFMCRVALVKWLEKNNTTKIMLKDLYELFFREGGPDGSDDHQRRGDFTAQQKKDLIDLLEGVTICDPAAGSGAFLVGMLHVLDDVEQCLRGRVRDADYKKDAFQGKQRVISRSLYGVEVKGWAVWITQLRLWITLFIDAPESMRVSFEPILPSLDFKVRQGDSLVQRIGKKMFPVTGHADIPSAVKAKVTKLKDLKAEFFQNKHKDIWEIKQTEYRVFRDILDAAIDEKKKKLRDLGEKPQDQMSFFGGDKAKKQEQVELFKERIESLKAEIDELQAEKNSLTGERPLIWNIEFAEIFCDKGGFDIIIGNPPYIRQEAISDPLGKIKDAKEYKNALAAMIEADFPREFKKEKINAQSDLYTYFYIRSLRLLNEKGVHVFICSNSWLDVGYGVWIQKFLLNYAPVHFIFDNHSKRSFAAADVNTIISVIGAPMKKVPRDHAVKFIAFKLPFEEVVYTENLLEIERARLVQANEKFRVYPIANEELFVSGLELDEESSAFSVAGKYIGEKWGGKFLRAPDIFFTVLSKGQNRLTNLGDMVDLRFGIKTGANEFFYLDEKTIRDWRIEKQFLRPVISSMSQINRLVIKSKDAGTYLFSCSLTKAELKRGGFFGALSYIEWGAKQVTKAKGKHTIAGVPLPMAPSVRSHRPEWFCIEPHEPGSFIVPRLIRERFFFADNPDGVVDTDMFFHGYVKTKPRIVSAILNCSLTYLILEILGRQGIEGRFNIYGPELKKVILLNPEALSEKAGSDLEKAMHVLGQREILKICDEFNVDFSEDIETQRPTPRPDRKKLDDIIFDAIGLSESDKEMVYFSLCDLVKDRLDKAESV